MEIREASETQITILCAAEELFSTQGYTETSLRQITRKAGVNLAAVNYHFESKESLFRAVILRRLTPLNHFRLTSLRKAEVHYGNNPVPLPIIIELFARPVFELGSDLKEGGHHFARVLGTLVTLPTPFVTELLASDLHPVTTRFAQAIRRHVGHLSPEDFLWRLNFVVGAMHHTLATSHQIRTLSRGICRYDHPEQTLNRFISFAVAGLTHSIPLF